jgi:hypothetical protein
MALPGDGAESTAGPLESCATQIGPVVSNATAHNAIRKLTTNFVLFMHISFDN